MKRFLLLLLALALISPAVAGDLPPIKTVFLILMENYSWATIQGNTNAPFINNVLLPQASYCAQYYNPSNFTVSLLSYLWLEAGTNFGITNGAPNSDGPPSTNHQATTFHLVTLLNNAGISWKAYEQSMPSNVVPLTDYAPYVVRHDPFVYFDDVTGTNDPNYAYGIAHIRPYTELAGDLANNTVASYNFITPDVCHDMHDPCPPLTNAILQADNWLSTEIPMIQNSSAYTNNGAIFITWDDAGPSGPPIGMIVLSPLAKGGGYVSAVHCTHSSTLRTMQEIFGVRPFLNDAAYANDLSDLFNPPLTFENPQLTNGTFAATVVGAIPGKTNLVQSSTNLAAWAPISTNVSSTNTFQFTDYGATNFPQRFYWLIQLP